MSPRFLPQEEAKKKQQTEEIQKKGGEKFFPIP
jgi:hypothetical protein